MIDGWGIIGEIALRWMSLDLTDDNSTLVQVMAWSRQATSHYLNKCWPRYLMPYGVTRPQWVKQEVLIHCNTNNQHASENHTFKIITTSLRGRWVNYLWGEGADEIIGQRQEVNIKDDTTQRWIRVSSAQPSRLGKPIVGDKFIVREPGGIKQK